MVEVMTSAGANKKIKKLQDEKEYLLRIEKESSTYIETDGYPVHPPEYDYKATQEKIREIDRMICNIKHAINKFNSETGLPDLGITLDQGLVRLSQLNKEKDRLDEMRKRLPKSRHKDVYGGGSHLVEYVCINYSIDDVNNDYDKISDEIIAIQMAIDVVNQTKYIEIEY